MDKYQFKLVDSVNEDTIVLDVISDSGVRYLLCTLRNRSIAIKTDEYKIKRRMRGCTYIDSQFLDSFIL